MFCRDVGNVKNKSHQNNNNLKKENKINLL